MLGTRAFGIVLWRFMGYVPAVLNSGFRVLLSAVIPIGAPAPGPRPDAPAIDPVAAGLRAIADRDPGFAAETFLGWAATLPPQLARGWADRNLTGCRPALTEDCWAGQQSMMERRLAEGWRLSAGSVKFGQHQIVAAAADRDGDAITVRFRATCPDEAARIVRGRRIAEWVEDWTFRRPVALAPPSSGITIRVLSRGEWTLDRMDHIEIHRERAA